MPADFPAHSPFGRCVHLDVLPVIHRANLHKLEGVVTLPDVLDAYDNDRIGTT
jgi:hypothetical protein